MADQYEHLDVKRYLPHAILTTLAVTLLPLLLVAVVIVLADPNPPVVVTTALAILFGMLTVAGGSAWWLRRPEASEISFGDLMIWGWWRRKRAEDQLAKGTRLLGLDRSGRPKTPQVVPREQQLHILRELTGALESKDPYTHGHSRRVERHVFRTAVAMGLLSDDIEDLRKAAALHDVGKIRVPDRILRKPEALTDEERTVLEDHVVVGAWMVSSAGNADVVSAVRHHHEQWDGSGYPDGLSATEIPLFSRIIAVADTFDAITSTRPYRAGADRDRALEVLQAQAGRQFDPAVVEAFISTLPAPVAAVVGALAFLTGPRMLASRLAVILKRAGAGALAPAAGATGAMILVGASTITPGAIADARLHHPVHAASGTVSSGTGGSIGSQTPPFSKGAGTMHRQMRQGGTKSAADTTLKRSPVAEGASPIGIPPDPEPPPTPGPISTGVPAQLDGLTLTPDSVAATIGDSPSITATATYAGQPVQGVAVLYSVSGASSSSGSCSTDVSGQCSFTYAGPTLPGADAVVGCGDANSNGTTDPEEPCGQSTVTWTSPTTTSVEVTGNGVIANAAGEAKITFDFDVESGDGGAKGSCQIVDATPVANLNIQCVNVSSLQQDGNHVTFEGDGTIDGVSATYRIDLDDNGDSGSGDSFQIQTSTGYSAGGPLVSGDIQIHK